MSGVVDPDHPHDQVEERVGQRHVLVLDHLRRPAFEGLRHFGGSRRRATRARACRTADGTWIEESRRRLRRALLGCLQRCIHRGRIVHGPTAPLESFPVVSRTLPRLADGLADGLGGERQPAALKRGTDENDVGQDVAAEEGLGDPLRVDEDEAVTAHTLGDDQLERAVVGPARVRLEHPRGGRDGSVHHGQRLTPVHPFEMAFRRRLQDVSRKVQVGPPDTDGG